MPKFKLLSTSIVVPLLLLTSLLSGCGAPDGSGRASADERPVVLTTFTVLADMAGEVAGENLRVESITKAGAEIHGYEPTPGDLRRAQDADLILDNGLNLESWFAQFVARLDVPHVVVSEGVEELSITEDAYVGLPNPHAWMSPVNAQIYVDNMTRAFSELDPDHASEFTANATAYKAKIAAVQQDLLTELGGLPKSPTCPGDV